MTPAHTGDSSETNRLLVRAASGDGASWGALLTRHEARLRRMVAFRLDPRLRGRVDASDVIQEVHLEASKHLPDYVRDPAMPLFLWLRGIAGHKLLEVHRHHLGTPMRDARREIASQRRCRGRRPRRSRRSCSGTRPVPARPPCGPRRRCGCRRRSTTWIAIDREILALRHIEQLTNAEAARVLGIKEAAAGKRYLRALERLRDILRQMPGGLEF